MTVGEGVLLGKCWQDLNENLKICVSPAQCVCFDLDQTEIEVSVGRGGCMARATGNVLDQGFSSLSKAGNGDRTAEQRALHSSVQQPDDVQGMCESPTDAKGLLCLLLTTSAPPKRDSLWRGLWQWLHPSSPLFWELQNELQNDRNVPCWRVPGLRAGMFGIQHEAPRMLGEDALLLAQGMKIQAWRRLLFGMGVFKIE